MSTGNQLKIVVPEWIIRQQNWVHVEQGIHGRERAGGGSGGASQLRLYWHFESQVWAPGKQPDRVNHHKELGNFLKAKKRVWRPMPWVFTSLRHNFWKFLKQGSVLTTKRSKPTLPNKPGEWVSEWVSECVHLCDHTHTWQSSSQVHGKQ